MTDLELIRRAQRSPGNQEERQEEGSASTDGKLEKVVGGITVLAWLVALDHFGLLERLAGHAAHLDFHGVVVDERNRHALAALSPDVDVVLIRVSGHVRGLALGGCDAGLPTDVRHFSVTPLAGYDVFSRPRADGFIWLYWWASHDGLNRPHLSPDTQVGPLPVNPGLLTGLPLALAVCDPCGADW